MNHLYQSHFQRLANSFGVANAMSYYWDNKYRRAFGDLYGTQQ